MVNAVTELDCLGLAGQAVCEMCHGSIALFRYELVLSPRFPDRQLLSQLLSESAQGSRRWRARREASTGWTTKKLARPFPVISTRGLRALWWLHDSLGSRKTASHHVALPLPLSVRRAVV